ncbi:MAG TPA: protein kinase, partial [Candidatus Angelobacter sp.]|nr:protein kinase [Candidatus Angelobacter sp.]
SRLLSPELEGGVQVRHPNVCLVNDIHKASTEIGDLDFITMEFLDGETLLARLSRGRLESGEAMPIARQLCSGLAEIHRSGVLHRDLKPANVILSSGKDEKPRAVITDFGMAVNQDGNTDLIGATPSYMAPELKQGGQTSAASDVYAFGVILYEMVTGQKPFPDTAGNDGGSPAPIPPSRLVKHLPSVWNDAILPCLAAQPEKRPSAKQILAVLDRPPFYRRPLVLKIAIAALVLLAASAFLWRPIYEYLTPPDIKLVILGMQNAGDMQHIREEVLRDVAVLLAQEPRGKPKFQLVPPSVVKQDVNTPDQAERLLHATHVLEVSLSRDHGDVAVNAAVVDAKTSAHIRDYSGHFSESNLHDLSAGLAGLVSLALHLPRAAIAEAIAPAAQAAYESGNNSLAQDDYSYETAIAQFQEAARLDPHSPLPLAALAEAYIAKYRVERTAPVLNQAELYLQAAEALNPDSPRVLLASSSLNILTGQNTQAVQDCVRALELEPENAEAWIRLGFANEMQHIPDQAQAAYRKAMDFAPNYYKSYEYLAALNYYSQSYKEAERLYSKARDLAPARLESYSNLGALLTAQARYSEAEKVYRDALHIKVTPATLNNLAATLVRQRDAHGPRDAEALPLYKSAVAMQPAKEIYQINLADSQRRLSNTKAANAAYQEALALTAAHLLANPSAGLERAYMGYCLARLHKNNAELEIGEALGSAPGNQQILLRAVLTYEALGKRAVALEIANKATPDIKKELEHHPDLADFNQDSRFKK